MRASRFKPVVLAESSVEEATEGGPVGTKKLHAGCKKLGGWRLNNHALLPIDASKRCFPRPLVRGLHLQRDLGCNIIPGTASTFYNIIMMSNHGRRNMEQEMYTTSFEILSARAQTLEVTAGESNLSKKLEGLNKA
jgi:hypothetical protein